MRAKESIGWIGLGKMGSPMCRNLLAAGYALKVHDVRPEASRSLVEAGAAIADSLPGVVEDNPVVMSMIPDDAALEAVYLSPQGVLAAGREGLIVVDMSTVSPQASARVQAAAEEKGVAYLRAPVSGSTEAAAAATLTIMVSGPRAACDACNDIFHTLGSKVFHVGEAEESRYLKLLINMMVAATAAMTAEALAFGKKGGLRWEEMVDLINSSVVGSPLLGFKTDMLKRREYRPMFTGRQMSKDLDLALAAGKARDLPMPLTALIRQLYAVMSAGGRGELDYFALAALADWDMVPSGQGPEPGKEAK